MKKFILLTFILSFFLISCENDIPDGLPSCIQDDVESALKSSAQSAKVTQYVYNGENVYTFDPGSGVADWLYTTVNEKCEVVCETGGFAGINTCPDFSENAELVGIIWEDKR